jgi:hypothetical protein
MSETRETFVYEPFRSSMIDSNIYDFDHPFSYLPPNSNESSLSCCVTWKRFRTRFRYYIWYPCLRKLTNWCSCFPCWNEQDEKRYQQFFFEYSFT